MPGGATAWPRGPVTLLLRCRSSRLARAGSCQPRRSSPLAGAQEASRALRQAPLFGTGPLLRSSTRRRLERPRHPARRRRRRRARRFAPGPSVLLARFAVQGGQGRPPYSPGPRAGLPRSRSPGPPTGRPGAAPRAAARRFAGAAGVPSPDGARRQPLQQTGWRGARVPAPLVAARS
jgi:hypothetical protein